MLLELALRHRCLSRVPLPCSASALPPPISRLKLLLLEEDVRGVSAFRSPLPHKSDARARAGEREGGVVQSPVRIVPVLSCGGGRRWRGKMRKSRAGCEEEGRECRCKRFTGGREFERVYRRVCFTPARRRVGEVASGNSARGGVRTRRAEHEEVRITHYPSLHCPSVEMSDRWKRCRCSMGFKGGRKRGRASIHNHAVEMRARRGFGDADVKTKEDCEELVTRAVFNHQGKVRDAAPVGLWIGNGCPSSSAWHILARCDTLAGAA
ncbi:hypothetical protein B0H19DRAFT_1081009 [Mycena capillaripes]|nr:hypothetical protein B0H19DRAFT_1081009 [Mycena capillaripes]